jgi:hypothetical protein
VDALHHGRSFAIVWADPDDPRTPKITVESAEQMTVDFVPGSTVVASAVKCWAEDDMAYATLYLPDEIWQYAAPINALGDFTVGPQAWELRGCRSPTFGCRSGGAVHQPAADDAPVRRV